MRWLSVASFYDGLASVAASLLDTYGQSVTFSRNTGGTFDPVLGSYSGQSASSFTGNGAAFDFNKSEIDGEIVQRGDIRLILEQTDTKPLIGDKCTVSSVDYRVLAVTESSPGGTVTHYTVQLRV